MPAGRPIKKSPRAGGAFPTCGLPCLARSGRLCPGER